MKANGNPTQWDQGYPSDEIIKKDIEAGHSYVVEHGDQIQGVFVFIIGEEPTYQVIENGSWHHDQAYGTIHVRNGERVAFDCFREKA